MDKTSLSGLDNFYLQIEKAWRLKTLSSVWIFDERLDSGLVHQTLDWLCDTYPQYASVPAHGSMFHTALWTRPIGWLPKMNVEHYRLKTPTREALEDYIADKIARPFIYSKPLWELHAISGLEDDRVAFLWKAHCCLGNVQHVLDQLLQNNSKQQRHSNNNTMPFSVSASPLISLPIPDHLWTLFPSWLQGLTMSVWHALSWIYRVWITVLHDMWIILYCLFLPRSMHRDFYYKGQQTASKQVAWSTSVRYKDIRTVSYFLNGAKASTMDILIMVISRCIKGYLDDMNIRHDDYLRLFVPMSVASSHHKRSRTSGTSGSWGWFSIKDDMSTHQQLEQIQSQMEALQFSPLSFQNVLVHLLKYLPGFLMPFQSTLERVSDIPHGIIVDYVDTTAMDAKGKSSSPLEFGGNVISELRMIPPQLGKGSLAIGLSCFQGNVSIAVLADNNPRYPRLAHSICDRFPYEFQQLMRQVSMTASRPTASFGSHEE
ncbi:hypothetical protein K492DRAFT_197243 [Lichtheimia hyalospora FSU 10163]|nr:hypothetical protein K492DRAFT_197243 [Lichtheimia hyalospora FSU 10163]